MNRLWLPLVLAGFFAPSMVEIARGAGDRNYVEGQVVVKFKPGVSRAAGQSRASSHSARLERVFPELSRRYGGTIGVVKSDSRTTADLIHALEIDPAVAAVEPDFLRHPSGLRPPDDFYFGQLWGLQSSPGFGGGDIGFLKAWELAHVATNTVLAVIDTGMEAGHPDLAGNVWTNASEIPANGLDDDENGFVDDSQGFDFAAYTADPSDSGIHGTHVAGTIAATGKNGLGVIGVAFRSQVMALKASSDGDTLPDSAIIAATDYCTMMKLRGTNIVAINASFGGPDFSGTMQDAIAAAGEAGIIFCAAAGNAGADNDFSPTYPASYRLANMIVVAASGPSDALASFSNYGAGTVDLTAPGEVIFSTLPTNSVGTATSVKWSDKSCFASDFEYSGTTTGVTATIYDCGLGYEEDFPLQVSNHIALIQRGTLTFSTKVANAAAAGARAVIIYNNTNGSISGTLQFPDDWLPAVWISQSDGTAMAAAAPIMGTVQNTLDHYRFLNGTSMAAPHVTGAAGFAAMNFPAETVPQRIARILQNVTPITNLTGLVISGGRLNLARLVDSDQNGLPDWWEKEYFGQLTGTNPAQDPDADGACNLAEWRAGTNPINALSVLKLAVGYHADRLSLAWPSAAGRFYRLLSTTNPAAGFGTLLRTNILATPPANCETNIPLIEAVQYFRLEIEP